MELQATYIRSLYYVMLNILQESVHKANSLGAGLRIRDSSEGDPTHSARSPTLWACDLEDTSVCIRVWCNVEPTLMWIGELQHRALEDSFPDNCSFGKQLLMCSVLDTEHLTMEPTLATLNEGPSMNWAVAKPSSCTVGFTQEHCLLEDYSHMRLSWNIVRTQGSFMTRLSFHSTRLCRIDISFFI